MKNNLYRIIFLLALAGCTAPELPSYSYNNLQKLDNELDDENACLVIDNDHTVFKKGHKNLSISPFLGQEGYSPARIPKESRKYKAKDYENFFCNKPIKLRRDISVSSISYPGTCYGLQYAGSIYTGATSYINSYGNISTTISSSPQYNITSSPCIETSYYINIDFYKEKTKIGSVESGKWGNYHSAYSEIDKITQAFMDKVESDYHNKQCKECYKKCKSVLCNIGCYLQSCNPDEVK